MIQSKVLENLEIKNLNHLGIIAGIIDEIGMVEIINKQLGEDRSEIVSPGVIVKAIIINGLGFLSKPLYLFPQFFLDKATAHLLGKGIDAENLNDDKIGRVMDKCYNYGISGYLYQELESNYGGIKQRWLIVESESRKKSDLKKLEQKIDKESRLIVQKLANLSKQEFETEVEANLKLQEISSKLRYHLISQSLITEKLFKKQKARYQITANFQSDESKITLLKIKAGRFIIATNKLDNSLFTSNDILKKYKEQQAPERGFAFLKDPLFFADSVFLKTPQIVETMAMLMGLCLLVYSLGQRQIRASLQAAKTGIKNQLGKLTQRPTLRWIFQCFQGIHLVVYQENQRIANLTSERHFTLSFFPKSIQKYYILSG